jgi:hypothetical protein
MPTRQDANRPGLKTGCMRALIDASCEPRHDDISRLTQPPRKPIGKG